MIGTGRRGLGLLSVLGSGRRFWGRSEGRGGGESLSETMSKNKIPDRWQNYSALGLRLPGTRFIAFKVPLKKTFERQLRPGQFFSPTDLLRQIKEQREELGKIIDLTFTKRYYDPKELPEGLVYEKIFTAGHEVPSAKNILSFKKAVQSFLSGNVDNDNLVGVHCTHGVNRTGYLICRYLIDVDGMEPRDAINLFNKSRGHQIERPNYIQDLLHGPCRSNKGIDVPAPCPVEKQKEPLSQQAMFKQRERPIPGKYPNRNGYREFSQSTCPVRQSAHPYVQHAKGHRIETDHTVRYNSNVKTYPNNDSRRQDLSWRDSQPEEDSQWGGQSETSRWSSQSKGSQWSGQPKASRWSGPSEASRWSSQSQDSQWVGQSKGLQWSGQSEASPWNDQPKASRWSSQSGTSPWSGQSDTSRWSDQSKGLQWSGQSETSSWSGQPKASRRSGQPKAPRRSGQPKAPQWSGQPKASWRNGQPKASQQSGQPKAPQWSGQSQSPWQSYQPSCAGRGKRDWKLNSGGWD